MYVAIGGLHGDLQPCGVDPGISRPNDALTTHGSHDKFNYDYLVS